MFSRRCLPPLRRQSEIHVVSYGDTSSVDSRSRTPAYFLTRGVTTRLRNHTVAWSPCSSIGPGSPSWGEFGPLRSISLICNCDVDGFHSAHLDSCGIGGGSRKDISPQAPEWSDKASLTGRGLFGGVHGGEPAKDHALCQAMHRDRTGAFASGVKAGDDLAVHIHDLGVGVDSQARHHVVQSRRRPPGVEGRRFDFVGRGWLVEFGVLARVDEGVVAGHRLFQGLARHGPPLIGAGLDGGGELFERVRLEEEAAFAVDPGVIEFPVLTLRGGGVEDGPDGAAPVEVFGIARPAGGHADGFAPPRRAERLAAQRLVIESLAVLLDHDGVLPVADREAGGTGTVESRAFGEESRAAVVPRADAGAAAVVLAVAAVGLTGEGPERGADGHGRDLAVGVLRSE